MRRATTLMEWRKQGAIDGIARTALELFARDGFEATSVEAICAASGCAPRTFYRYFGTKEDVMFHDLPVVLDEFGQVLDRLVADGLGPWAAVCEAVVTLIGRFDATDQRTPTQRINLWLEEPALRARYMQYINQAEHVVSDCLHRHRGTTPERDELPQLIAVAAIGAYRVTILTHTPAGNQKLAKHLREALDTIGALADEAAPALRRRAARVA
jgi:AcrR family transcriptional regulator